MRKLGIVLYVAGIIIGGLIPFVYWFQHDTLSTMQMFKLMWPWYGIGGVFNLAGYFLVTADHFKGFLW